MSLDRYALDYDDLLAQQEEHLRVWRLKVRSEIGVQVGNYCREQNSPAATANDKHRVFRGSDIAEIIKLWPTPESGGYPPRKKEGSDFV